MRTQANQERTKRSSKKKTITLKTFVLRCLFVGVLGYFAFVFITQQFDLSRLREQADKLDGQIAEEQRQAKENESLKEIVGTDEYTEDVARERLGFMKPGERVFIVSGSE